VYDLRSLIQGSVSRLQGSPSTTALARATDAAARSSRAAFLLSGAEGHTRRGQCYDLGFRVLWYMVHGLFVGFKVKCLGFGF
jgi:uncharacterized oligopeptide transporter (OPT) family protein